MATPNNQGVSLRPSDAQHGTGLLDDVDVTLKQARFVTYDYDGKSPKPVLCLGVTMTDEAGEDHDQYYSAGDLQYFVPSNDGKKAMKAGNKDGLNDNTNAVLFLSSLVNAGFPEDKLGDDISAIEGTYCHVNRVAQPKRGADMAKDRTILQVMKIHSLPWEKSKAHKLGQKAAVAAGKPQGKANGAAAPADDDMAELVAGHVAAILAEAGGSLAKAKVTQKVFQAMKEDPANRTAAVKLANDSGFLEASDVWSFDGATLTLNE